MASSCIYFSCIRTHNVFSDEKKAKTQSISDKKNIRNCLKKIFAPKDHQVP